MKKYLLGILLLLVSIIIMPNTINIQAETTNNIVINTLYPEGVLDYHNLTDVNQMTINDKYIAYTLDNPPTAPWSSALYCLSDSIYLIGKSL